MPNEYRPIARGEINNADARWTVEVRRLMDTGDPVPEVADVKIGRNAEIGWGDMKTSLVALDALPPFAPSFLRVSMLDRTGAIVNALLAIIEEGQGLRALELRLVEDLDDGGALSGPWEPADGYAGPREWHGYVTPETVQIDSVSNEVGTILSFHATDGLDRAEELGVTMLWPWPTGIMNVNSFHGALARLLYRDGDEGVGLAERPIRYAQHIIPNTPNVTGSNDEEQPPHPWPSRTSFHFQTKDDGVDSKRGDGTITQDPQYNAPTDMALVSEVLASTFYSRVFQDFDGWHIDAVPMIGEGTSGSGLSSRFFFDFDGPNVDGLGTFGELAETTERLTRVWPLSDKDLGEPKLRPLAPITRITGTTKRDAAWPEPDADLVNVYSMAMNGHLYWVNAEDTTAATTIRAWTHTGTIFFVLGDSKSRIDGLSSVSQKLLNMDGPGAEPDTEGQVSTDLDDKPQYIAARMLLGIGLNAPGVPTGNNIKIQFRLDPDDGGDSLYIQDNGSWGTSDAFGVVLTKSQSGIGLPFDEHDFTVAIAYPIPKPGTLTFTLESLYEHQSVKIERIATFPSNADGEPYKEFRSAWAVWDAVGSGTDVGTRRPGKSATLEMNARSLGPALRNTDDFLLDLGTAQYNAVIAHGLGVEPEFALPALVHEWSYLNKNGAVESAVADVTECVARPILDAFGSMTWELTAKVRGRILTPGDAITATVHPIGSDPETLTFIVAASRGDLWRNGCSVVAIERPRSITTSVSARTSGTIYYEDDGSIFSIPADDGGEDPAEVTASGPNQSSRQISASIRFDRLLFSTLGLVRTLVLDPSETPSTLAALTGAMGIWQEERGGYVYATSTVGTLTRLTRDGLSPTVLYSGLSSPTFVVSDGRGGVYWLESDGIHSGNWDGSAADTLIHAAASLAWLAIDPVLGYLFFGTNGGAIQRITLAGTGLVEIVAGALATAAVWNPLTRRLIYAEGQVLKTVLYTGARVATFADLSAHMTASTSLGIGLALDI